MRINHNIPAFQTASSLYRTTKRLDKSVRSMSTGFKINSAKDDAASMAIANKLRTQVKGLQTASQNALDGISLIQTAEAALGEIHNMLQRMRELTVQAANGIYGTLSNDNDKEKIKMEIDQMMLEITDTAKKTEFNKIKVLSGELLAIDKDNFYDIPVNGFTSKGLVLQIGPNKTMEMYVSLDKITSSTLSIYKNALGEVVYDGAGNPYGLDRRIIFEDGVPEWLTPPPAIAFDPSDPEYLDPANWGDWGSEANWLQFLKDNFVQDWDAYVKSCSADMNASRSIAVIDVAIAEVSQQRAFLGAVQNRLEHTVMSLDNNAQNTEESRSRIEDTDMAYESIIYSSSQVIAQAAIAILAQANQRPHQILQLLR